MTPRTRWRTERGQSVSVFALVVMAALIMATGLVIDGGQKVTAASEAEAAAAGAARSAANAAATQALGGSTSMGPAVTAARRFLAAQPDVSGSVSVAAGVVTVRTESTAPTIFLSAIGISTVRASGFAQANIVPTGQLR